jgi:hypothetical protein
MPQLNRAATPSQHSILFQTLSEHHRHSQALHGCLPSMSASRGYAALPAPLLQLPEKCVVRAQLPDEVCCGEAFSDWVKTTTP